MGCLFGDGGIEGKVEVRLLCVVLVEVGGATSAVVWTFVLAFAGN